MDINELFCNIDDVWKAFEKEWKKKLIKSGEVKRNRKGSLNESEIMTIMILFHQSYYRNFKAFYTQKVCVHLKKDFTNLVSYSHFVSLIKRVLVPMYAYINSNKGAKTGVSFVDSTSIKVCHNKRIARNKVFRVLAKRGGT